MATRKFKFKHIAQDASQHVGDAGELILDTATNTLKVSNGSTAGGVTLNTDGNDNTTLAPNFFRMPVYASTTARDAAITSPAEGDMCLLIFGASTRKVQVYLAGSINGWENVGP
tara:strand:- start:361 stop:702 length:342 start_codon:yes stop_codon:yes gene_type:complete